MKNGFVWLPLDTGYYGDTCSSMFRICNANPCTNNGSCVQGAGPEDYTCSCPDGKYLVYDILRIRDECWVRMALMMRG
ncbi:hypothetical protein DPMN_181630 [Dreissena polymorpha]|uniref:EGF-like domain-containing protein n=1 Tax=Dreissena polymorpha TaxID=45954 RepID=A0A9D4DEG0_DREPO|nr:hypothetical protein DPMN_181630 [Dreissena polymorpha]